MLWNRGVTEDHVESLGLYDSKPVHPKGNQPVTLTGRTDAEAEVLLYFGHL